MSAHGFIVRNAFQPSKDLERLEIQPGVTIQNWKTEIFGEAEFNVPTVIQLNGEFIMRADWSTKQIEEGDSVFVIMNLPGEPISITTLIIIAVVAVATVLLMPDPSIPGDNTPSGDSVYTFRGQKNQFRPGEPIEVIYGKVRRYPTYACRPYSLYKGNKQYQYSLYCLGQGKYDIQSIQLDDTPIGKFEEVEYEIVPPGQEIDLFESNVITSLEVSNLEMVGPNEPNAPAYLGPYVLNPWETPVRRIAMDVTFPQGLFELSKKGKLGPFTVDISFDYREIGEFGGAIGVWTNLISQTITCADNTPQRRTLSAKLPAKGRFQIRGKRITPKPTSTSVQSQCRWEAAKGYGKNLGTFEGQTMIAVKVLATNDVNDSTAQAFNVRCTRKLPQWDPVTGWSGNVATRNPIWAFCDLMRAKYGAKLPAAFLDLPALYNLAQFCETKSLWFDWIFDSRMSIWEAAQMILRVARAVPVPQGSLITAIRDTPQNFPAGMFNQNNIVKGSITKKLALYDFQPFDGLMIEYTDQATWKPREIKCVLPGRAGTNLDRLKLPGCTNRTRAYREGMYIQSRREFQRKTVTFRTGMEGHIPAYLDLIAITDDTIRVGQGGIIVAYNTTTRVMTLSEQVVFASASIVHKIAIRGDDGALMGAAIGCVPGATTNQVILDTNPVDMIDFSLDRAPPLYAFGVADEWAFMGKVVGITPAEDNTVEITCLNYVPKVYGNDDAEVIEAVSRPSIVNSTNPEISWINLSPVPQEALLLFVDWSPSPGTSAYMLETTYDDGVTWNPAGTFANGPAQIGINPGTLKVRVAPFSSKGNVIWKVSSAFVMGSHIPLPQGVTLSTQLPFVGLIAEVTWLLQLSEGFLVGVRKTGTLTVLRTIETRENRATYSYAQFLADGSSNCRSFDFDVTAYNSGGESAVTTATLANPVPVAPTGLAIGAPTSMIYPIEWTHTKEADFREYRIYISTISGFTPGPTNLQGTYSTQSGQVTAAVSSYLRVAALDVWGDELALSNEVFLQVSILAILEEDGTAEIEEDGTTIAEEEHSP